MKNDPRKCFVVLSGVLLSYFQGHVKRTPDIVRYFLEVVSNAEVEYVCMGAGFAFLSRVAGVSVE